MWQGAISVLRQMVRGFADDRGLGVEVVYKRITGTSFNAQTQTVTPAYAVTAIRAITGQKSTLDGNPAPDSLGKASRMFSIVREDLDGRPRPGDLIEIGADRYRVGKIVEDTAGVRYRIEAERQ